jgi:hypothetical protein
MIALPIRENQPSLDTVAIERWEDEGGAFSPRQEKDDQAVVVEYELLRIVLEDEGSAIYGVAVST